MNQIQIYNILDMKKILIQEDEKSQILQKHQDFKKILQENLENLNRGLIQEQVQTGVVSDPILNGAIAAGCISGGQVISYGGKPTYYKVATKDNGQKYLTGDKLLINADFTYDVLSKDNVKKGSFKWACPNMNAATEKQQQKSLDDIKNEYKNQRGAQEYSQLLYKAEKDNPNFYKKVPLKGVDTGNLYIPQFKKEFLAVKPEDYPEDSPEREILQGLVDQGYILNPSPLQKTSFRQHKLDKDNPELGGLFPNGIVVYIDPRGLFNKTSKDAEGKPLTATGEINVKECKTLINQYWEDYRDDISGDAIEFNKTKAQVMACKRRYYPNRWGLLGIAGNQIDKKIEVLSRQANEFDGLRAPSRTSKWLLN
jgi:hypothetical protein